MFVCNTHLGYAAKVGDSTSDSDSFESTDSSECFTETSLPLTKLDMDTLQVTSFINGRLSLELCSGHRIAPGG